MSMKYYVHYNVHTNNISLQIDDDDKLGTIEMTEDGFYNYYPNNYNNGYLSVEFLKSLVVIIDILNKNWTDNINEYHSESRPFIPDIDCILINCKNN